MAAAVAAAAPSRVEGQVDESGAVFLLFPVSARSVGVGGAQVADVAGTEAVLSNPAAFGRLTRSEGALHYGQDAVTNRFLVGAAVPSRLLGTVAASILVANLGQTTLTDPQGTPVGEAIVRNVAYAASYGSMLGKHAALGLTYKYVQFRFDCTGECTDVLASVKPATSALDFGAQYDFGGRFPLTVGAAVRNVGLRLQVQDREQADPLPTQASVGVRYSVPHLERYARDVELRLLGEVDAGIGSGRGGGAVRVGAEGIYRRAFTLRAGYVGSGGEGGGPAIGIGYVGERFAFDLAQQLTGFSVDAGQAPRYIALRYWF